jgi:carboxymethylenebutenolidase
VHERLVDIPAPSGAIDTFITQPQDGGPFPAVIIYMDIWGLREELFDVARRIATVGYCCLVPNFYHRQGKIRNEYRNAKGQMVTLDRLEKVERDKVLAPLSHLTDAMVVEDTGALLQFIGSDQPAWRNGALGCIGYCMGGRHVFRAAANFPNRFRAMVSLHGTDLVAEGPDSPHLGVVGAQGEIYCGFGEHDRHTPPATVETLARTLPSNTLRYTYTVHKNVDHGYALPDRDIFDKQAANRDWEVIFAMFRRQLQERA